VLAFANCWLICVCHPPNVAQQFLQRQNGWASTGGMPHFLLTFCSPFAHL
jgi:hypothetical protein